MKTTIEKDKEDAVYLEEGSDLMQFECDVNKALMHLSEFRDINHISFKTGIQEMSNGITKNWYSMAIHHKPKGEDIISKILKRLDKSELESKKFKSSLEKLKNSMKGRSKKTIKVIKNGKTKQRRQQESV